MSAARIIVGIGLHVNTEYKKVGVISKCPVMVFVLWIDLINSFDHYKIKETKYKHLLIKYSNFHDEQS